MGARCGGIHLSIPEPGVRNFPAQHWVRLRVTSPIESTFATVPMRKAKTKGTGTRGACLTIVFMRVNSEAEHWCLMNGRKPFSDAVAIMRHVDGVKKDAA